MENKKVSTSNEKLNNRSGKKNVFIIAFIVIVILLIGCIVLLINNRQEKQISSTGHFYGKPYSIEDIDGITIVYNNGKDYVSISGGRYKDNKIYYRGYGEDGNISGDYVADVDTSDIIKYIYEKDLKYLKKYDEVDNAKWSLRVDGPGKHCLISGKKTEPEWFKELLKKLNVDENGYLSNSKFNNNSNNKCLEDLCYKLYDDYYIDESDDDFVNIKYEDNKSYCFYTLEVKENDYENEKSYIQSMDWLKKYKIDNITINNQNYNFIDYSSKSGSKDYTLITIYKNKLYDINIHMGADKKNYKNCMVGYNYFKYNLYIK